MELTHLNQISFNELGLEKIDCLIATVSHQSRCTYLAQNLQSSIPRKILLVYKNNEVQSKTTSCQATFTSLGFQHHLTGINEPESIENLLYTICNIHTHQVNVAIDYSCMPKKWYALIIDTITRNSYLSSHINLFLSYTPKVFEKDPGKQAIEYLGPVLFNRDKLKDKKPVSLIASLDNTKNSILEAISTIKPQKFLAFIPYCPYDPGYSQLVIENNKSLLERLDDNSIIHYEIDRPEDINTLLTSHCLDERIASEVMIIPQGPKTFSMMSMLLSVRYPDVKVWEIIHKTQVSAINQGEPAAEPVVVKVSFIGDDDLDDE